MTRGLRFNWYDASDEDDAREGFEEIQEGMRKLFDQEIKPYVVKEYGEDDTIAINEAFNNWTDSLSKDGEICDYVYVNVTYED